MKLVVFDVDGTLTLGDGLGTRCFFSAFEAAFGAKTISRRLDAYRESTDAGIAREALEAVLGRAPSAEEMETHKRAYLGLLEEEISRKPGAYRPVPGADRAVARLLARGDWAVALATGNWRRAAALKLSSAAIPLQEPMGGFSEDGEARETVLRAAIGRFAAEGRGTGVGHVVYVGDQPWDLAAARAVGIPFIGIARGNKGRALAMAGARVVEDLAAFEHFLAALDAAEPPAAANGGCW